MAKAAPPSLRKLFIGDVDLTPDEWVFPWARLGDLTPLHTALPGLRALHLRGQAETLGKLDLPELREFTLESGSLDGDAVQSLTTARWPKLGKLEIWFGAFDDGAEAFDYFERRRGEHPTGRVHRPVQSHEKPTVWAVCVDPV